VHACVHSVCFHVCAWYVYAHGKDFIKLFLFAGWKRLESSYVTQKHLESTFLY